MPKVISKAEYDENKTVKLGEVSPGHAVLVLNPIHREAVPYQVCRVGNTALKTLDDHKTILLVNIHTGRIVLKSPELRCVVISSEITLNNYDGEFTRGKFK